MTVKSLRATVLLGLAAVAASIAVAPLAAADMPLPTPGAGPASEAIDELEAEGFDVAINWLEGHPNVPLRECRVTSINNPSKGPVSATELSTVYVDVVCPNAK